jgi:hypothetical protein
MWRIFLQNNRFTKPVITTAGRYPAWVMKTAFFAAAITIIFPTTIIVLLGLLIGGLVFFVLSIIARVLQLLGLEANPNAQSPDPPANDGRENVRVMDSE